MGNETRVDAAVAARGLAPSREQAQELIRAGMVLVNGRPAAKPSEKVSDSDELTVTGEVCPYVSRGGFKLEKAIRVFDVDCAGKVCLDVGASTGGFTDVLLRNGAALVYALDVGTGQLAPKLKEDPRVVSMEHTNARNLTAEMFDRKPELAVMDVSFISVTLILPALFELLGENGRVISLIKPQFECGRSGLGKNGIVKKSAVREQVLLNIAAFPAQYGWTARRMDISPIKGTEGNTEYLAEFVPVSVSRETADIGTIKKLIQ